MAKLTKTEENILEWMDTAEQATPHNLWLKTKNASFEAVYRTIDSIVQKGMAEKDGDKFKLTLDGKATLAVIIKEEVKKSDERKKEFDERERERRSGKPRLEE